MSVSILSRTSMAVDILKNRNTNPSSKDSEGNSVEFYTNRNLKETNKVTKTLIQDIKDGNFLPSTISVSSEGILVNGQHRLYAISEAGPTVTMIALKPDATLAPSLLLTLVISVPIQICLV